MSESNLVLTSKHSGLFSEISNLPIALVRPGNGHLASMFVGIAVLFAMYIFVALGV